MRNDSWYWIKPDPYNFEQDGYMFTVLIEKPHYIQHTVKEVIEKFNGKEFKIIPNFIEPKHLTELEKLYKKGNKMELSEEELQRVYELEEQNKSTF